MLKLELEKENFKRYNNGIGYKMTVENIGGYKVYRIFKSEESEYYSYFPQILVYDDNAENKYTLKASNYISINNDNVTLANEDLEKYLTAYKIAKESIEEFEEFINKNI